MAPILYWFNGACDPIEPFKNDIFKELAKIVGGKIFSLQWEVNEDGGLGVLIYVENRSSPEYLYLDWYSG